MSIRKALTSDLVRIARLHKEQFKDHFLGRYSEKVIQKFYEPFLDSCIFLVNESDGMINGFILGGIRSDLINARHTFLSCNKARYIAETLLTPSVYIMALKRLKMLRELKPQTPADDTALAQNYLLSIAVSEDAKGSGLASELLSGFEGHICRTEYGLSVYSKNTRAINFYTKNGFKKTHDDSGTTYFSKIAGTN
ncbi:acetyltransferase (GNAT) family protein [Ruminiclostridium sufflavum DSM 19573]|uniref:Acetyltransferase (GNAT) family protein n=1 Tax=Ruminiclostridium sufflavum DSM 19573 TaxID=1121337 RepID=A0A318XK65_9FIRM|nr:GNAT family N-acetyltransferase [Ruminiclostridium sufflavum]PYG87796.1 acetyltransferase (GNAT) family protein [Ruminiclostridium sufflavum DSM 19573]